MCIRDRKRPAVVIQLLNGSVPSTILLQPQRPKEGGDAFLQPGIGRPEIEMRQRMDKSVGQLIWLSALHIGEEHAAIFKRSVVLLRQIDDVECAPGLRA